MNGFAEGYNFFAKSAGASVAGLDGQKYIGSINAEINKLAEAMNQLPEKNMAVSQLKGVAAEHWHAGTHNINAAVSGSSERATVLQSKGFASVDIAATDGKNYGLKYYSDAASSANSQSTSYFQIYNEEVARCLRNGEVPPTVEQFLSNKNLPLDTMLRDPVYAGQIRVIPSDQLQAAKEHLERKIAKLEVTRPEEVQRYKDTLANLNDKLESADGTQSIPLSERDSRELAQLAKEGAFDPDDHGLNTEGLVKVENILGQAFKAGLTAAAITMALKTAPEIYKCVDMLVKTGRVDSDQFKNLGFAAVTGSSEGFFRGSISAVLTVSCHAGHLGAALKDVQPEVIGALTVLMVDTIKNSFLVAAGKMSKAEMLDNMLRGSYSTAGSIIFGMMGSSFNPVFGFMVGSLVGSVVGSFVYSASKRTYLSLAINNGYTFFGLVEQDYVLPEEIINEIGLHVFEYEKFTYHEFNHANFNINKFELKTFTPETIGITVIRRGVIGVNRIGYLT